jgi:hypothetical protein
VVEVKGRDFEKKIGEGKQMIKALALFCDGVGARLSFCSFWNDEGARDAVTTSESEAVVRHARCDV